MLPSGKTRELIATLKSEIQNHTFDTRRLSDVMTRGLGGTDASGAWSWRLAFDLMQIAAGRVVQIDIRNPQRTLVQLAALMGRLPTETRRSERQVQLQQFSTPFDLAFVASYAARIQKGDLVLEPSAGTGSLATMAAGQGAKLLLNELDPQRRALLQATSGQTVTDHDAEFIADLIDDGTAPSVVLMNPPFASSATRSDPTIAARHVLSALKALRPGGRLVAIVPPSVSASGDAGLWRRICNQAAPVLRLHLPRTMFRKMGASVSTDLLVLDKSGAGEGKDCPVHSCVDLETALSVLRDACPPRVQLAAPAAKKPTRSLKPAAQPASRGRKLILPGQSSVTANVTTPLKVETYSEPRANKPISDVYANYAPQRISIEGSQPHPSPLVESLAMGSVHPPLLKGEVLSLPQKLVTEGVLSEAQLETILMAETSFSTDLPGRFVRDDEGTLVRSDDTEDALAIRQGYFLGDGTGCGKGRQVAGTILAGWLAGRRKACWVSKSQTLIEDSVRDWTDIGGGQSDIHAISRWKPDEEINLSQGILFCTYATLRSVGQSGARRLDQILRWLGDDFDGVIAFDEAHEMQNAGGGKGNRGVKAASQQGLAGLRLQNAVPRARVLYVSATGATEVSNLAYASRLGLWGQGPEYPFPSRAQFVSAMEAGGVAAMEVVARDLKALGLYTARALSFEGVEYDILEHALTPGQVEMYDTYASAFKTIHTNLQAALEATGITNTDGEGAAKAAGAARSAAISAFESTKQRFFNHLLQGLKAPAVIEQIRSDIEVGFAPVVQIVSTGEALLKRRLETLDPDEDLTEGALTPRDYVVGYLERAFPVTQQVLIEQEDGSVLSQPLRDEQGQLVISREAVALREAALEEIMLLAAVPSALDQIMWAFGPEIVREVTGRSQRPVKDDAGNLRIERRGASANSAETKAFMSGDKVVLIFSDAGGTGRSYHAAQSAKNQARRRHYLLEPG